MSKEKTEKKVKEVLDGDTSKMSLAEIIDKCGGDVLEYPDLVLRIRRKHELDTDIPMEEDDFGIGESDMAEEAFPDIVKRLK